MNPARYFIVSLHDVHPSSFPFIQEQIQFCEDLGITQTSLLVIPEYHQKENLITAPNLIQWLIERQQKGDEIVLHGYYHQRVNQPTVYQNWFWTQFYTQNEAEFLDLTSAEAEQRIKKGLQLFQEVGLLTSGFIAPAWLMNQEVIQTIFRMGFCYTNTLTHLLINPAFSSLRSIPSQSLCYSSRALWRRQVSVLWNRLLFHRLANYSLIRISLHPRDLTFPFFRKQIKGFLRELLHKGFQPISYENWVKQEQLAHG